METRQSNKDEYERRAQACGDKRRMGTVQNEQRELSHSHSVIRSVIIRKKKVADELRKLKCFISGLSLSSIRRSMAIMQISYLRSVTRE